MAYIQINNYSVTGDCSNTNSGAVYFRITGDTPNFGVVDGSGLGILPTSANTTTYYVTGLSGGTYWAEVYDSAGTKVLQPIYISTGTTATIDSSPTSCGLDNGTITGFTAGVYGSAKFILYDGSNNYITSADTPNSYYTFTSLSAGTYYIVANDGGGCTGITASVILTPSTPFSFSGYVVDNASCLGGGSGKIIITGLTPPVSAYTINWISNVNGQTGTTVTGLTGGTYIVSITNPDNCTSTSSFSVGEVDPLGSGGFITLQQPSCFTNDGEVEFIVVGGTAPYFFSGSSGQVEITFSNSVTFTGLSSGAYSFLVTDAGLCTIYDSVSLQTPNSFSTVAINTTNSSCSSTDGTIQVLVDNGTSTESSLLISVSGTSGSQQVGVLGNPNQTFYGLPNGTYIVTVVSLGCTYTATTTITSVNLYSASTAITGTTCGSNNGRVEVTVSTGGTLPYSFTLTGPTYNPNTITNAIGVFTNLNYGNYTLTIQDSGSPACIQSYPVYVEYSEGVYFDLFPTQPLNGSDGTITSLIYSGEPPFNLIWSGGSINGYTGSTVTGLTAGTYSLTCTDISGCSFTKSITLTGTKKYTDYRYYTICEEQFYDSGLVQKKTMRSMYLEGFNDLTSGDTNCVINSATFSVYAEVSGITGETLFYTSTGATDYPTDTQWANAIIDILEGFEGISGVTVDIIANRITVVTGCDNVTKNCVIEIINPLQDSEIKVDLIIDYNISCVSCS
jgi:large repetitive protein